MKNIFIILIILGLSGCFYQEYYTEAEIIYGIENIEEDVKIDEAKIEVNGYFENVGETRNTGVKKVKMYFYFEEQEIDKEFIGRETLYETDKSINEKLEKVRLEAGEKEEYNLTLKNSDNNYSNLTVSSIRIVVSYY